MLDRFLKLLSRWLPVVILVSVVFNLIASYGVDNTAAVSANIVALIGWLYVVMHEFTGKKYLG
jgi:membrane associated rhomboid family serine protease